MLPTDAKNRWKPELIHNDNATHMWDGQQVTGKWFAQHLDACPKLGPVAWDVFYLFDGEATWEDEPAPCISCGAPVINDAENLEAALEKLFGDGAEKPKP